MRNKLFAGIALIALLSALSLSSGQTREEPPIIFTDQQVTTATLAGRLLDKEGNPISGALVYCVGPGGKTGFVTGADGSYRFNLSRNGHYTIQPRGIGYLPSQADFDVIVPGADFIGQ
ncbi:MAG: carboxypeptidase-like regulatory domain-containing protein [Pyrinomonadaceae bacterium]